MKKLFKEKQPGAISQTRISSLPPIRLQSGEHYQPVKIIRNRNVDTNEVVGVVNIDLTFIPKVFVNWATYPTNENNPGCVHVYFITACNVLGSLSQYLLHPSLNDKCRLHGGDLIRIKRMSLISPSGHLVRPFASLDDFELVNPQQENLSAENQGLDVADDRLKWWTFDRQETEQVLEDIKTFGYPSLFFNKLNYWFEQCPYIPRIQLDINEDISETSIKLILDELCVSKALEFCNIAQRISKKLVAVVIGVRKAINYLIDAKTPVLPLRIVLTVMDHSGCCDVILWNEMASVAMTDIQIGSLVLLKHFSLKWCKSDRYAIIHPSVPRVPVELSIEQGVNICSSGTITKLPQSYLEKFSFPSPFYNFDSISNAPNWVNNDTVSVVGLVVGISRYHLIAGCDRHIGRNYIRRWIELCDIETGATVAVCLYVNRCLERHSAIQLNSIVSLTNLLVKRDEGIEKLKYSSVHSAATTEVFVVPGPGDDNLPSVIHSQVEKIKETLRNTQPQFLTWIGGVHHFENYMLEKKFFEEKLNEKCWGLKELQDAMKLSISNQQLHFVFVSRIARVELCDLPKTVSLTTKNGSLVPSVRVGNTVLWESQMWKDAKLQLEKCYGADKPCFESLTLSVVASDNVSKLMQRHLQFPSTNILEELDVMEQDLAEGASFSAEVIDRPILKITFEHLVDKVALCVLFSPEESSAFCEKFKDVLKLDFVSKRKTWGSPIPCPVGYTCRLEMDLKEEDVFKPWIRMQCLGRDNFEFQLCYLGQ